MNSGQTGRYIPLGRLRVPPTGPIYIVDDSEDERFLVAHALRRGLPNTIVEVENGEEFLNEVERVARGECAFPALVLLDINMPGIDGFEVLRQLRGRRAFASRPAVAMMTNLPRLEDARRSGELGADRLVEKGDGIAGLVAELHATFSSALG